MSNSIRFASYKDGLEQRQLGDLIVEHKETVDSSCTLPVLTSSKTEGIVLQEDHFGRGQQHDITGYNVLPRNYCTYRNRSDGTDFTFNINECCDEGIISKFYPVFYGNNSDISYISLLLNNNADVVREIGYTCVGTGQKVLSFLDLKKIHVNVPSLGEQMATSALFKNLDRLILLEQKKLDDLKNTKSAMLVKMFPKERESVPEVRFEGFSGEWVEARIGDIFDFNIPNNTLSRAELSYEEGIVLDVHYGDVLIKYGAVLDANDNGIPRILGKNPSDYESALLQDGDIIIADTAEDETAGKAVEISNAQNRSIVSGLHTMVCRPRLSFASGYLGYYLNAPAYHNQLLPLIQGTKVYSISKSNVQGTNVIFPSLVDEQAVIANYFSNLDCLIALHQRKLDKLKDTKKAMLNKMFCNN